MTVAVANQRVCIWRHEDVERQWVPLRELLRDHLGRLHDVPDEEQVALTLMGQEPSVCLEAQGGVAGVARTFRMSGALDVDPHFNREQKGQMERDKVAYVWSIPYSGLYLRYPLGVRARGADVDYGGFR